MIKNIFNYAKLALFFAITVYAIYLAYHSYLVIYSDVATKGINPYPYMLGHILLYTLICFVLTRLFLKKASSHRHFLLANILSFASLFFVLSNTAIKSFDFWGLQINEAYFFSFFSQLITYIILRQKTYK